MGLSVTLPHEVQIIKMLSKMKTMKLWRIAFMMLAAFSLASCGSDEPRYADPEAHEKTVQLNEQYGPLMVGTWHYENISDTQRYFECLTFQADGTLTGMPSGKPASSSPSTGSNATPTGRTWN